MFANSRLLIAAAILVGTGSVALAQSARYDYQDDKPMSYGPQSPGQDDRQSGAGSDRPGRLQPERRHGRQDDVIRRTELIFRHCGAFASSVRIRQPASPEAGFCFCARNCHWRAPLAQLLRRATAAHHAFVNPAAW